MDTLYGVAVLSSQGEIYARPDEIGAAFAAAELPAASIALADVVAVMGQALTEVVASLLLAPPDRPGALWRNQTLIAVARQIDGTLYTAPYGAAEQAAGTGILDPVTALLPAALARVVAGLPTTPPASPGVLWLNGGSPALSPALDGTPYPVTPMPSGGAGLLGLVRARLPVVLAGLAPALPLVPPLVPSSLWRDQDHLAFAR